MAATASAPTGSTGRRVRFYIAAVFLIGMPVQFYLAGRGLFGAGNYEDHQVFGTFLNLLALVILIETPIFREMRNRVDIGLAAVLFVLTTVQGFLATFDHPDIGALHPVNALLITGAAAGLVSRDARLRRSQPSA